MRYEHAAWDRKVSRYQFRGPGEWFVEAYFHYYGGPELRKLLKANDPNTKAWFTDVVDKLAPSR